MTVDRLHQEPAIGPQGNASDHLDRIAQSGMFSGFRRLNANGDVETGLGRRSTVFVNRFYADEPGDRQPLVGLRSKDLARTPCFILVYSYKFDRKERKHMKDCFLRAMMVVAIIPVIAAAQHNTPLAGDGHPDLNGTWVGSAVWPEG